MLLYHDAGFWELLILLHFLWRPIGDKNYACLSPIGIVSDAWGQLASLECLDPMVTHKTAPELCIRGCSAPGSRFCSTTRGSRCGITKGSDKKEVASQPPVPCTKIKSRGTKIRVGLHRLVTGCDYFLLNTSKRLFIGADRTLLCQKIWQLTQFCNQIRNSTRLLNGKRRRQAVRPYQRSQSPMKDSVLGVRLPPQ